jgi:hypothetical protein
MSDSRELIQRMARELDLYRQILRDDCTSTHRFADEARALLAQTEPEGPTDMARREPVCPHIRTSDEGTSYCALAEQVAAKESAAPPASSLVERMAIALAESEGPPLEPRGCPTPGACSCPTSPIVPPELIRALELAEAALAGIGDAEARAAQDLPRIRAALARWGRPAIEPVPVSERLPGEGDCDPSFQCWWFTPSEEKWILWPIKWVGPECSHWLPHYALPIPTFTETP